jgi:NAD(P)-dependent dehydrogenase (short-subunit alcohol dehydrogenase family)
MRLASRHVVVIGGSSGIGLETARLALAEGASVTIAGRSEDRLRRAAEELAGGAKVRTAVADVTAETSVRTLFEREARVDHVFLPAGELRPGDGDVLTTDVDSLRSTLETRLLGAAVVVRHARGKMSPDGSITLMSGLYSTRPGRGSAFGAAAVAAVEGMTRALALDLAPTRVNAVAPGLIDTPLWNSFGEHRAAILASTASLPVGRAGRPEEVAQGVVFLMCNGFVTGTVLTIDGGGSLV